MLSLKVFTVLLLATCIFANPLFKSGWRWKCQDDCYVEGIKKFFVDFADGKPEFGVKPMDPIVVKNINFPEESLDLNSYFPELKDQFLKTTCDDKDGDEYITCVKSILEEFFKQHSTGAPDKGIKSMDPATIDHIEVVEDAIETKYHYTNMRVTGFKDAKVSDFTEVELKKDSENKVTFTIKFDFVAEGPLKIDVLNKDKSFSGNVKYEGGAVGVVTYNYDTKKIDNIEVYEMSPEQITCESQHAKGTPSEELRKEIESAPDLQALREQYAKIEKDHEARVVCAMAKAVLKTVFENLRVLARQPNLEQ